MDFIIIFGVTCLVNLYKSFSFQLYVRMLQHPFYAKWKNAFKFITMFLCSYMWLHVGIILGFTLSIAIFAMDYAMDKKKPYRKLYPHRSTRYVLIS
jgi:hypothetical protein